MTWPGCPPPVPPILLKPLGEHYGNKMRQKLADREKTADGLRREGEVRAELRARIPEDEELLADVVLCLIDRVEFLEDELGLAPDEGAKWDCSKFKAAERIGKS